MAEGNGNGRVRVVITGMGVISPLGLDRHTTWQAAREGRSGIDAIESFDAAMMPSRIGGEVKGFDAAEAIGRKEARRSSRASHFAVVAAREAVADSGLDVAAEGEDVGVLIASGIGGIEWLEHNIIALDHFGPRRVSPFTVPSMITDMPAGMVAIDQGAKGPNFAVVSACASGAHAIGEAAEWIRRGDAIAVLAGGTEAPITATSVAAFSAMQALSTRNDAPERASRPFDKDRNGFVIAEGATILVLEELSHAQARGARIYAELVGYGATADASHITQPDETGDGARRCMERALKRAGAAPEDVDYINAHGTSTQLNDAAETRAFKRVFGDAAYRIPISSTKSMTGHLLGAAGALEAFFSVMAIQDGFLPPTINLDTPDPACDLDYIPHTGREASPKLVISTSFGFGGHNACLAIAAPSE
jgi:3-oxoacyl-[acyl-carrier-protein] synthase II